MIIIVDVIVVITVNAIVIVIVNVNVIVINIVNTNIIVIGIIVIGVIRVILIISLKHDYKYKREPEFPSSTFTFMCGQFESTHHRQKMERFCESPMRWFAEEINRTFNSLQIRD